MYTFYAINRESVQVAEARALIGHGAHSVIPSRSFDCPLKASGYLKAQCVRFAEARQPALVPLIRAMRPGDIRRLWDLGRVAHVQIGDTVLVMGDSASIVSLSDVRGVREVAARNAANRAAVACLHRELEAPVEVLELEAV